MLMKALDEAENGKDDKPDVSEKETSDKSGGESSESDFEAVSFNMKNHDLSNGMVSAADFLGFTQSYQLKNWLKIQGFAISILIGWGKKLSANQMSSLKP